LFLLFVVCSKLFHHHTRVNKTVDRKMKLTRKTKKKRERDNGTQNVYTVEFVASLISSLSTATIYYQS
jgi:hypothetical protein